VFAKFMAAPHYAYNIMKMSGPRGVITIRGSPEMVLECEDNNTKIANAIITTNATTPPSLPSTRWTTTTPPS
jgi:hypothetical protein